MRLGVRISALDGLVRAVRRRVGARTVEALLNDTVGLALARLAVDFRPPEAEASQSSDREQAGESAPGAALNDRRRKAVLAGVRETADRLRRR